jgi:hypothetical protein
MKRQRGRGRKPGNSANRSYESNGPEVKIRGNASQIYDKYLQLARDSSLAGDRVRAENLYQHAEHYYRIVQLNAPKREAGQDEGADNTETTGEDGGGQENTQERSNDRSHDRSQGRSNDRSQGRGRGRGRGRDRSEQHDPMNVVKPESGAEPAPADPSGEQPPVSADGEEAPTPRRRSRRPRRPTPDASDAADQSSPAETALENASASADAPEPDDTGTAAA